MGGEISLLALAFVGLQLAAIGGNGLFIAIVAVLSFAGMIDVSVRMSDRVVTVGS